MARLKIDLQNKYIEIEGNEDFISEIYTQARLTLTNQIEPQEKIISKQKTSKHSVKESYAIVKDLNLNEPEVLNVFRKKIELNSALEKNTAFVYYLEKIAGISNINLNHIYTCYKEVGEKMPAALKQSLADTSSKKGWIDTQSMSDIKITVRGESLIENVLKVKVKRPV